MRVAKWMFTVLVALLVATPVMAAEEGAADEASMGIDFSMGSLLSAPGSLGTVVPTPDWNDPTGTVGTRTIAPTPYFGFRYKLSSMWLRLGATIGYTSESDELNVLNNPVEQTTSGFSFGLDPGVEIEMAELGRVKAVAGGFVPLGYSQTTIENKQQVGNNVTTVTTSSGAFWAGLAPMLGAHVRILDGLTLGAEYRMLITFASISGSQETAITGSPTVSSDLSGSEFYFRPGVFSLLASFRF